jgi:hypothetical protein
MKLVANADLVLSAIVSAAQNYTEIVTDHDPDDGNHVVPGELRRFMARLRLLHGVPFSYLVPDAKLLPLESIRFFYIDRAWTDALVQGALSVGTITTADRTQLEAVYSHISSDVDETERTIRKPKDEELLRAGSGTITGFLMRSRVVSGFPNLHVRAYSKDRLEDGALTDLAESHPDRMKVLRMERLAPAVLLVLFDGVPAVVHVEEPRQGIQFGVRIDPDAPPDQRRAKVQVRDCENGNVVGPADDLVPENSVDVPFRSGAPGVIDIATLRTRLAALAPNSGGSLESNEYALQMLRFPYRQVFGDPENEQGQRFYDVDRFEAKVSLTTWKGVVAANLARVTP